MTDSEDDDDDTETEDEEAVVEVVEDVHDCLVPCSFSNRLRRLSFGDEDDSSSSESIQTAGASILLAIFYFEVFGVFSCFSMQKYDEKEDKIIKERRRCWCCGGDMGGDCVDCNF